VDGPPTGRKANRMARPRLRRRGRRRPSHLAVLESDLAGVLRGSDPYWSGVLVRSTYGPLFPVSSPIQRSLARVIEV
jgi:hypothetical protein